MGWWGGLSLSITVAALWGVIGGWLELGAVPFLAVLIPLAAFMAWVTR